MAKHTFPVPTNLFLICKWFLDWKTLNKLTTQADIFIYLLDHGYEALFANMKLRHQRWPENIGEVWNPVCCHGNKAVKLKLWSTSRISLQRIKHFLIQFSWYILFHHLVGMTSSLGWLHTSKTWISLEQKDIFENSKLHFSYHASYLLMLW